jgi:hypothetical protein
MPRNKKSADEGKTKRVRSVRNTDRRKQRKERAPDPNDLLWLTRISIRTAAARILNDAGRDRPYWLSIPKDGPDPVAEFFPCTMLSGKTRVYYGFMFRHHRDEQSLRWVNSRKELTGDVPVRS